MKQYTAYIQVFLSGQCLNKEQKLIKVFEAKNEMEAHVIKSLLESHSVPSVFQSNAAPSVHVFTVDGMGKVNVLVPKGYEAEAKRLIEGSNKNA